MEHPGCRRTRGEWWNESQVKKVSQRAISWLTVAERLQKVTGKSWPLDSTVGSVKGWGKSQTGVGSRQNEQGGNGAGCMAILSERFTIREGRGMEEELTQG